MELSESGEGEHGLGRSAASAASADLAGALAGPSWPERARHNILSAFPCRIP